MQTRKMQAKKTSNSITNNFKSTSEAGNQPRKGHGEERHIEEQLGDCRKTGF